jgi:adenylate cyclase
MACRCAATADGFMTRHQHRLQVLVLATAAALIGFLLLGRGVGALDRLELDSVDARFALRGETNPGDDVVIVDIDAATFQALDEPWPIPRSLHARVIDRVRRAGASVIAYDVQFTERTDVSEDNALIAAVGRARDRIVLGTTEVTEAGETAVLGGEPTLRKLGAVAGSMLFPVDADGANRRLVYEVERLKTMAVASAELPTGEPVSRDRLDGDGEWIDFRGPPGTVPTVSFSDVLRGRVPAEFFRGRAVVVGTSAPTLQDVHPTATTDGELMSGAEIHANAISTVRRGLPLHGVADWIEIAMVVLIGLAPALAGWRFGLRASLAYVALTAAAWAIASYLLFRAGIVLPVVYPLVALLLTTVGALGLWLATSELERAQTRAAFARFVPSSVAAKAIAASDDERLGVESRESTVVFVDLRGFTPWAEAQSARRVMEALNRYTSEVTEAVERHGGTMVSLRGDGILAVFGAPERQPRHADQALAAVCEIAGPRLEALNAWVRDQQLGSGFSIGIGVSTGPVMSGNVGSPGRMEYTIIGDAANTACRLEEMTKDMPYSVLISGSTRRELGPDAPDLIDLDSVIVRGKRETVGCWTLAPQSPGVVRMGTSHGTPQRDRG